jgi:hypothetical protein
MRRRSVSHMLSNEEQSLQQVWGWYEFQRALIGEEKSRVLDALSKGEGLSRSRHVGKTRQELDDEFAYQADELGLLTTFGLLACTEAALRVDFIERVKNKKKDEVSRACWAAYRKHGIAKIRLEEDILVIWRDRHDRRAKLAVAEFKSALNLRHWLAHGRYWKPKLGRAGGYDAVDIYDICNELLEATGLMKEPEKGA